MLPSKGYFSGFPCVFFSDGGCSRPHCHYWHSYEEVVSGDVEPKTQNARPVKPTLNVNNSSSESSVVGLAPSSWSPAQVSLVTRLVENAVDKALRNDQVKMPRCTLVKNTLDKLFMDPEALKMASNRKSSSQADIPAYKPTPISKLTTKHIPVLCVPEKPYSCLTKTRAHGGCSNSSKNLATNLTEHTPPKTKQSQNAVQNNFDLAAPSLDNAHGLFLKLKNSASERLKNHPKSNSELNCNFQELNLIQAFYGNNTETELAEDSPQKLFQIKNFTMQCRIPLKRLAKSEFEKYSSNQCRIPLKRLAKSEFEKYSSNKSNSEKSSTRKASSKSETKSLKKSRLNTKNNTSSIKDLKRMAETDPTAICTASEFKGQVMPEFENCQNSVADADVAASDEGVMDPKTSKNVEGQFDCYEPPTKKKKSESVRRVTLQVSSSGDPFSRWMKNKKIREILGRDKKLKDSCQKPTVSGIQAQKRPSHHKTPSGTSALSLEEELPEPKISKRIAHIQDEFRPIPISAEDVKIPSAFRHHFIAAFFEAFKKTMPLDVAKRKAAEEELQVAKNSKTAKTYKNNCSLLIVKYRKGNNADVKLKPEDLTPASCPDFTYGWSLYQAFSSYLLSESGLKDNGFPLAVPNMPNCAYVDRASRRYSTQQPEKPFHKICANCSVEFQVDGNGMPTTADDCFYHWGKLRKIQYKGQMVDKFTCCGGSLDSAPCEFSVYHVWSGRNEDCMDDFVETKKLPSYMEDHEAGIYALDCEMCYTTDGLELARLTVLDLNGRVVFDQVISMKKPILNYCTRFSGIDARKIASATYTFDDVRRWILEHFYDKTILVGHSLENDLKALKLIHRTIVDTSVTFPHKFGPPNKMSLKHLANVVLELNIQENIDGHDSKEDAATCLKLMMKKIQEDSKARKPRIIIGYNGKKK